MLRAELSKFAIKVIGWDATEGRRTPRIRSYGPTRSTRHNDDQTIPTNFHPSDVSPCRLHGFHSAGQIGLFEIRRASHETSNGANFAFWRQEAK
jgi:hypothetical protein